MQTPLETLAAGFLIAAPTLRDPNFDHTVVLICLHSDQGAMGLVINRPAPVNTRDLLQQIGIPSERHADRSIMIGGPVSVDSGVLLYRPQDDQPLEEDEIAISDNLRLCPNQSMLHQIADGTGPSCFHIYLGHAGWSAGQLEQEIGLGAWIPAELRLDLIFETPVEERWEGALLAEGLHPAKIGAFRPQS